METKTNELSGFDFDNVRNYFTSLLEESIAALPSEKEYLDWYEDCSFDDYFANNLEEIWSDDDGYIGDGFREVGIIVTDKNKQQLEKIFESVRDEVYNDALQDFEENQQAENKYIVKWSRTETDEQPHLSNGRESAEFSTFEEAEKFAIEELQKTDMSRFDKLDFHPTLDEMRQHGTILKIMVIDGEDVEGVDFEEDGYLFWHEGF